jgi:prepilin-type N-terminal cleavage/methylation domain-containing protein
MKTTPHKLRRSGFTLIELLTVIAIIGILAAILIPTVSRVRENARSSLNRSNVRQITMANVLFEAEYKVYAPDHFPNFQQDGLHRWPERVAPYAGFARWDTEDPNAGPFVEGTLPKGVFLLPGDQTLAEATHGFKTAYLRNITIYGSQVEVDRGFAVASSRNLLNPSNLYMISDYDWQTPGALNDASAHKGRFGGIYTFGMADGSVRTYKAGSVPENNKNSPNYAEMFYDAMKNR